MIKYKCEEFFSGNTKLALNSWHPSEPKAVLFYIHGMQSNAGWLFETGKYLASKSIAVYVLDRRGSGKSKGLRGDVQSAAVLLNDYFSALEYINQIEKGLPLTLLGQSLGGSILLALLVSRPIEISYNSVIFCAPAFGQMHSRMNSEEQNLVLAAKETDLCDVNLPFDKYTNIEKYLNFLLNDKDCVTRITRRSRSAFLQLENIYVDKDVLPISKPTIFIRPRKDEIINLECSEEIYQRLFPKGIILKVPTNVHYIEFSNYNRSFWDIISAYILSGGLKIEIRNICS